MSHISPSELEHYSLLTLQKITNIFDLYNKKILIQIIMMKEKESIREMKENRFDWIGFNKSWEKDIKIIKKVSNDIKSYFIKSSNIDKCLIQNIDNDLEEYQKENDENWLFEEIKNEEKIN